MPKTGDTNRVDLYLREVPAGQPFNREPGADTTTAWQQLRYTGEALEHQKQSEPSAVIRSDRMKDAVAELAAQAAGTIDFEISATDPGWINIIEGLIGNDLTTAAEALGATYTNNGGTPVTTDISLAASGIGTAAQIGGMCRVTSSDTPADDGLYRIVSIPDANTVEVVANLTNAEQGNASVGSTIINGTVIKAFEIEKAFTDLDVAKYMYFGGLRPGQASLSLNAQARITNQVSFDGRRGQFLALNGATHNLASIQTDPMTASANVASILIDEGDTGTLPGGLAPIKAMDLTINGNNRLKPAVGDKYPIDIGQGTIDMTGTFSLYFQDEEVFNLMEAHTYFSIRLVLVDAALNTIVVYFPRAVFSEGSPTAAGENADVEEPKGFIAVRDATLGYGILYQDIPAGTP